eukprot:TRINITY_DN1448_c0_g1_i1.p1 TRINITY_DN1448_c0_g1~~TRINITY_DN1448_c0_g1_i1.p1  ORF type:complete len:416 (+),score=92.32 TRINITY_DN1448_c0_g1_i1:59-1306(+)
MGSTPTDYASLWDGFEPVSARVTREQRTLREFASFVTKRAAIEESYAKSLLKLAKIPMGKGETGYISNCLQALKDELEDRGKVHLEFAQSTKEEAKALDKFSKDTGKISSSALSSGLKMTKNLATCKLNEAKVKDKYYKYAQLATSDDRLAPKAETYNKEYQKRVELLKTAQSTFYSGMPPILQSLQSNDEQFLDRLEASFNSLVSNLELMLPTIQALPNTLKKMTSGFDKSRDIQEFIASIYTGEERPPIAEYQPRDDPRKNSYSSGTGGRNSGEYSPKSTSSFGQTNSSPRPARPTAAPSKASAVPAKKASRISRIFNSPNEMLAKDKNIGDYYDEKNYYNEMERRDQMSGGAPPPGYYRCRALYDWTADDPEAISLTAGEVLDVNAEDSGWLFGVNQLGQSGRFPASYAEYV